MDYRKLWKEENESVLERYELSLERIRQMKDEQAVTAPFRDYFAGVRRIYRPDWGTGRKAEPRRSQQIYSFVQPGGTGRRK